MNEMRYAEAAHPFKRGLYKTSTSSGKEQEILVLTARVSGLRYHVSEETEEGQAILKKLTPGYPLRLFRESDNERDEWAVALYTQDDELIGYISRFKNQTIARLMDAGKRFTARIDPAPENEEETAGRYPGTENSNVYYSVYLVEE